MGRGPLTPPPGAAPARAPADVIDILFALFLVLSAFHLPVMWIGDESIGLYDAYLVAFVVFLLVTGAARISDRWREYFLVVLVYLAYLALHLPAYSSPAAILLAIKNTEMFLALFATVLYFERRPRSAVYASSAMPLVFLLLALFQVASWFGMTRVVGIPPGFGVGVWDRVGLPFMQGTSSNPAGFVLGAFLVVLLENVFPWWRGWRKWALFALVAAALLLTISRTNILAFIVTILVRALGNARGRPRLLFFAAITLAGIVLVFSILAQTVPEESYLWNAIRVVQNPRDILLENTFRKRYGGLWPEAFRLWRTNLLTVFFGNGLAFMTVVDGTVPRLLVNKGLVGLGLFAYLWFVSFLARFRGNGAVKLLLLFAAINSISGETLLTSYRSIQVYIPMLVAAAYLGHRRERAARRGPSALLTAAAADPAAGGRGSLPASGGVL